MVFESREDSLPQQGQFVKGFDDPPWWIFFSVLSSWANSTSSVLPAIMFSCEQSQNFNWVIDVI